MSTCKTYRIRSIASAPPPGILRCLRASPAALLLLAAVAAARAAGPSETALQAAAAGITAVGEAAGAAHGGLAAVVDGGRAASDSFRTGVEIAASLLQVPQVSLGQPTTQPPPQVVYVYPAPAATTQKTSLLGWLFG